MKKIRIGLEFIDPRKWMGGYNYLLNMVRSILSYEAERITPVLFAGNDVAETHLKPFYEIDGVTIVRTEAFDAKNKKQALLRAIFTGVDHQACDAFKEAKIDVVFEVATYHGWRVGLPTIAWIPDFQHRMLPELFGLKQRIKRELGLRFQLYTKRALLLSSQSARANFESLYNVRPNIITVAPFAIDTIDPTYGTGAEELIAKYQVPDHFFYLPNQYYRHKNHPVVIQALKILQDRGTPVVVVSSGNSDDLRGADYYRELVKTVQDYQLENHFLFLGMIPYSDVVGLMKSSQAVINPSRFEGWSTTVEEAKSLKIPLILSGIDVHREQATHAQFFEPGKAGELAEILTNCNLKNTANVIDIDSEQITAYQQNVKTYARTLADMFLQLT